MTTGEKTVVGYTRADTSLILMLPSASMTTPPSNSSLSARFLSVSSLGLFIVLAIFQWKAEVVDAHFYPLMAVCWVALLIFGGGYCIMGYSPQECVIPRVSEQRSTYVLPPSALNIEEWIRRNASEGEARFTGPPARRTTPKSNDKPNDDMESFYREMANNNQR